MLRIEELLRGGMHQNHGSPFGLAFVFAVVVTRMSKKKRQGRSGVLNALDRKASDRQKELKAEEED